MKILSVFIVKVFLFLFIAHELCIAKEIQEYESNKNLKIFVGYPIGSNDWGYTHPFVGSEVTRYETETGSFTSKSIITGQLELSKKYFGLGLGAGFFPSDIIVDKTEDLYTINSIFLEFEGLLFPLKSSIGKIVPILRVGGGGVVSSGDLKTTALFYSIGAGIYSFVTKNIGASVIIKNRYFTYDEIPLDENITGDIKTSGLALQLGIIYSI
ncbi:hypothetical protein ACFL5D_02125 [Candidatus Neomarinimicrobiota bacterium]